MVAAHVTVGALDNDDLNRANINAFKKSSPDSVVRVATTYLCHSQRMWLLSGRCWWLTGCQQSRFPSDQHRHGRFAHGGEAGCTTEHAGHHLQQRQPGLLQGRHVQAASEGVGDVRIGMVDRRRFILNARRMKPSEMVL